MSTSLNTDLSNIGHRFVRDFGKYAVSSVVPGVLGVLLVIVLTRVFPADVYGRYALAMAAVVILSTSTTGWLGQAILRFEPELNEQTLLPTVSFALVLSTFVLAAVGAIGYYALGGVLDGYRSLFLGGLLLVIAHSVYSVVLKLFEAGLQPGRAARLKVTHAIFRFVFGVGIGVFVLHDIAGWFVGAAIGTIASVLFVKGRNTVGLRRPRYNPDTLKRMLAFGGPMIGWLLGFTLLTFIDRTLIELLAGSEAVGIYSANYSVANKSLPLVLGPVIQASHPIIMNAWDGDNPAEVQSVITDMTRYFLIVGVPATVYLVLFARPLSSLVVAPEYHAGYLVIPFVGVGVFVWSLAMIAHKGLEVMERSNTMLAGVAVAVVVNVLLNIPLIDQYGYLGAAGATLVSFVVYLVFAYVVSRRHIRWEIPTTTLRNVFVATLCQMIVVVIIYELINIGFWTALAGVPPSGLLYIICLYTLGEIRHDEVVSVRSLLQQTD